MFVGAISIMWDLSNVHQESVFNELDHIHDRICTHITTETIEELLWWFLFLVMLVQSFGKIVMWFGGGGVLILSQVCETFPIYP